MNNLGLPRVEVFEKVKAVFENVKLPKRFTNINPAELAIDAFFTLFNDKVGNFYVQLRIKIFPEQDLVLLGVMVDLKIPPKKLPVVRELLNEINNRALIIDHVSIDCESKTPIILSAFRYEGRVFDDGEFERVLSEILDNARLFFPLIGEQLFCKFNILG
jgi:hypothetical protein